MFKVKKVKTFEHTIKHQHHTYNHHHHHQQQQQQQQKQLYKFITTVSSINPWTAITAQWEPQACWSTLAPKAVTATWPEEWAKTIVSPVRPASTVEGKAWTCPQGSVIKVSCGASFTNCYMLYPQSPQTCLRVSESLMFATASVFMNKIPLFKSHT